MSVKDYVDFFKGLSSFADAVQSEFHIIFKSDSHLPKKLFYLLQWNPFKNDENAFYFILSGLFILKVFNFSLDFLVM